MPRDGSNIYSLPPGTHGVSGATVQSTPYNAFTDDVATDLNLARPIVAGGTGANSAAGARTNLKTEVSMQAVTNFDTQVWEAGSFTAAAGATSAPTANAQTGSAFVIDANNVVVRSTDFTTGTVYSRRKTAGVWGAWSIVDNTGAIRYDLAQSLTDVQQTQGRQNIYAAPFDAMAYSGMNVNGYMDVSQILGAAGFAISGAAYVIDQWGCNFTQSSAAGTATSQAALGAMASGGFIPNCMYVGTNAAAAFASAGNGVWFYSPIEGFRVARVGFGTSAAQPITISFWVNGNSVPAGSVLCVAVRNGSANRSYVVNVAVAGGNVWEYKTITIPGDTTGTWAKDNSAGMYLSFAFASNASLQTAANTWTAGNFVSTPQQTNFYPAANTCYITGVCVFPGTQAPNAARSPYIIRPYGEELRTCERYLEVWRDGGVHSAFAQGVAGTTSQGNLSSQYRTRKRIIPTLTYSAVGDFEILRNAWAAIAGTVTAINSLYGTPDTMVWQASVGSATMTVNEPILLSAATTAAQLRWDARL